MLQAMNLDRDLAVFLALAALACVAVYLETTINAAGQAKRDARGDNQRIIRVESLPDFAAPMPPASPIF